MKNQDIHKKADELLSLLDDCNEWGDYLGDTDRYLKEIAQKLKIYLETGVKPTRIARTRRDDNVAETTILTNNTQFSSLLSR